jgi:hypothetical protein
MTLIKIENRIINVENIVAVYGGEHTLRVVFSAEDSLKVEGNKAKWLWTKLSHMCMYDYDVDKQDEEDFEDHLANQGL